MNQEHFFKTAKWTGAHERAEKNFAVLKGRFSVHEIKKVTKSVANTLIFALTFLKTPRRYF